MKDKAVEKQSKTPKYISAGGGILAGLLSVLFLTELFKGLIALILVGPPVKFIFTTISLNTIFNLHAESGMLTLVLILVSPLLASIIFIELAAYLNAKTLNDSFKSFLLFFLLTNVGYIIINVIGGVYTVIFEGSISNDWWILFSYSGLGRIQQLLVMFLILLIVFSYVNNAAKRLRKQIPMIHKNT